MCDSVERFLSEMHRAHLKPLGFRKRRHTFDRDMDGYTESFNIQGSAWNSAGEPWRFYMNVGIDFPEIGPRPSVRIANVVMDAPEYFDLTLPPQPGFAEELAALILRAADEIAQQLPEIREAFSRRRFWIDF